MIRWLILIVFIALLLASCNSESRTVNIMLDYEGGIPGMVSEVTYEHDGQIIEEPELVYDSSKRTYYREWKNVEPGTYSVEVSSVLLGSARQSFRVDSDTALLVKNNLPFRVVKYLTTEELMSADTVEFAYVSSGCFNYDVRKFVLTRDAMGYSGSEEPTPQFQTQWHRLKTADAYSLLCDFKREEDELERLKETKRKVDKSGVLITSTSREYVFIRAGDAVYTYEGNGGDWQGYRNLFMP